MGVQGDFLAGIRKMKKGGVVNVDFVTQAGAFHQNVPRRLLQQYSSNTTNQSRTPVAVASRLLLSYTPTTHLATRPCQLHDTLVHMGMAKGNSQGIGSIGLGLAGQPQQRLYHMLHLGLVCTTGAHHRLLDLPGRVLVYRQARSEERRVGKECRARWWA